MNRIRWGVIGPGRIARKFADAVRALPDAAELAAVASGTGGLARANAFGDEFDIPRRYDNYADLARDPDLDAVYIATPHTGHHDACLLAIAAGKAVLCEKPLTVNEREAAEVIAAARRQNVFLMEALWTRFLPAIRRVREWIDAGAIGPVRTVHASFGFQADLEPRSRLSDPALAGGALLDVGLYPLHLASLVFGPEPASIRSVVRLHPRWGVDEHAVILLGYPDAAAAVIGSSFGLRMRNHAIIEGTAGIIEIPAPFHDAQRATLIRGDDRETFDRPHPGGNGFVYQVEHVCACLRDGQTESEIMPLDESRAVIRLMDRIRGEWGLRYPADEG